MNRKLYVLSAVLGSLPALFPVTCSPWASSGQRRAEESRGGASRRTERFIGGNEAVVPPSSQVAPGLEPGVPAHPCELITVMQVPCDPASATCEYTYWQCPESVEPLRA
ncbi:hypothetical protein KYC5002_06560 [Archangium violaceum]|uniref:hypothetical protein n=1 Tax=Archangium violaceum TaxID=83451 RepID=UPI002B30143B|nr:hypothetical protein KYC5002_06560 [Archangium gephyra]